MKVKQVSLAFSMIVCTQLSATPADSLISFANLSFNSEAEKLAFTNFKVNATENLISILLVPYKQEPNLNLQSVHEKINTAVNILSKQIEGRSESKKAKIVYEHVHKAFFTVYDEINSFYNIFDKGEYNCVSASALYAVVFSKLGVPYQIKETPQHVYLVVYPYSAKVLIETTSPQKGYYSFSDEFAGQYVKNLLDAKVISKEEKDTSSITTLFNKYFFSSENISLAQLAGIQYSNFGLYYIDENNYSNALKELKKAYYLYPSERHKFLLKQALLYELSNKNYSSVKEVEDLSILCHFNNQQNSEISNEVIKSEFNRVIQTQLINNSDYERLDSSFTLVSNALSDTTIKNDIIYNYHYELARLGFINSRDTSYEFKHLQSAYAINPKNVNLQSLIIGYFFRFNERSNNPKAIINLMINYSQKFPFLDDNDNFNSLRANCFLELSFQNFTINNLLEGTNYLREFEQLVDRQKNISLDRTYVEKAYTTAAGTYYKKGNYAKSKELVKTGLVYAPESFILKQMLNQY